MSTVETHPQEIAPKSGQQIYDNGNDATLALINARQMHDTARMKCYAAMLAAGSADIDSRAQEIVRQAEKEVDDTELTLSNLEARLPYGATKITGRHPIPAVTPVQNAG